MDNSRLQIESFTISQLISLVRIWTLILEQASLLSRLYPFYWQQYCMSISRCIFSLLNFYSTSMIEVRQHKISMIIVANRIMAHRFSFFSSDVSMGISTEKWFWNQNANNLHVWPNILFSSERKTKLTVKNTNARTAIVAIMPWASCPSSQTRPPFLTVSPAIPIAPQTIIKLK